MHSTFGRALTGFFLLTAAITLMAVVALWALATFGGGIWWASLLVVLVALVVEGGVYSSTLHEPIYNWINEPERLEAEAERRQRAAETAETIRKSGLTDPIPP